MQSNDLVGRMVLSKAGRDKNHVYVIIRQLDSNYVIVANGSTKTIHKPKKKKIKHVLILDYCDDDVRTAIMNSDKSTDLIIKRFLKLKGIVKEG